MKRASRSIIVAVVAACLLGASATVASASPDSTSRCLSGCHVAGTDATISASLASTSTTTATYQVTMAAPALSAWAVFDGTTRLAGGASSTGTFTVDLGKTYNVYAVNAATQTSVLTSVSPAAPAVEPPTASLDETVAPVTVSDAVSSYVGNATVTLSASDGAGQGVSYIYYSIDGARVHLFTVGMVAQTSVVVPAPIVGTGTHTITYWSQDKAGNVETHKTSTFTVAAVPPAVVKTLAKLTRPAAPSSVAHRTTFTVSGYMTPRHASGSAPVELRFYRYKSGHYVYYKTLRPRVYNTVFDNYSRYSVRTTLPYAGRWRVRAAHGDALHLTSYSAYEYMTVR